MSAGNCAYRSENEKEAKKTAKTFKKPLDGRAKK